MWVSVMSSFCDQGTCFNGAHKMRIDDGPQDVHGHYDGARELKESINPGVNSTPPPPTYYFIIYSFLCFSMKLLGFEEKCGQTFEKGEVPRFQTTVFTQAFGRHNGALDPGD